MVFSSLTFLFVFLPIFLVCYFAFKNVKIRNFILLVFSIFFYAWGEPFYVILIIFSILINYYLTKVMDKTHSKKWLITIVIINILLLMSFKYTNLFITTLNDIFNISISNLNISLPIGISFYTFQALSYVIDVYRKKVKVQNNIFYLACYIVAFPQLIAGPIVRYETIEGELNNRKISLTMFASGIRRFIIGLSKKVLIANNVAFIADQIFNQSASSYGFIGVLIGVISYTLQIYFDFSGYSDMAIGLGKMLGFNYDENFNLPYIATSITDFWRRWHISLSTFFRDYVYIPLGGNKVKVFKHIRNILIVWALTGFWHGASWNFVLWGLYYAMFLIIEKYFLSKILDKSPKIINHIYTLLIVIIGWLIFRATTAVELKETFKALFGFYGFGNISILKINGVLSLNSFIFITIGIICSSSIMQKIKQNNLFIDIIMIILFVLCIIYILVGSYNPFIYFRF